MLRFWVFAQNGTVTSVHLERAREQARLRTRCPLAISLAQDQKLIGILTGDVPDCGPQPGRISPTLGWSVIAVILSGGGGGLAEWCCSQTSDENISKCMSKHHLLTSLKKVKKYSEDISAIGIFF